MNTDMIEVVITDSEWLELVTVSYPELIADCNTADTDITELDFN